MSWCDQFANINYVDHAIDFGVILVADVIAALIAVRWFENHRAEEEQRQASSSLNKLYQVCTQLRQKYKTWLEGYGNSSDETYTGLSRDITDVDREFAAIDTDFLFWVFPRGREFRSKYTGIKRKKDGLKIQTIGQARTQLGALVEGLDEIISTAEAMLTPKPSMFHSLKSWFRRISQ